MILPKEYLNNNIGTYFDNHGFMHHGMYKFLLFVIICTLSALPLIHVDISYSCYGTIRTEKDVAPITAPVTEIVNKIYIKNGEQIRQGDTILTFKTDTYENNVNFYLSLRQDYKSQIHDLEYLSTGIKPNSFFSNTIQTSYKMYSTKKSETETYVEQNKIGYERYLDLHNKGLISDEEYEKYYYSIRIN